MTNGDKIRGMTNGDLARWISSKVKCPECRIFKICHQSKAPTCELTWLEWLEKEAENG